MDHNIDSYRSHFDTFERTLNGESSSSLHTLRRRGIGTFLDLGFPTSRQEEWKYTNIAPIAKIDFTPALHFDKRGVTREQVHQFAFPTPHRLVFIDGHLASEFSTIGRLPKGAFCGSLDTGWKDGNALIPQSLGGHVKMDETPFVALNTAFIRDGAFVLLPDGASIEEPVHLIFLHSGLVNSLVSPRNLILLGRNSHAAIVETYACLSNASYLTNAVTEIVAADDATLEHDKVQNESKDAFHVSMTFARLGRNTSFRSNSIAIGGSIVRNNVTVVLDDEGGDCTLNGLSLGTATQLIDNHTTIDHAKPHCTSHELYKSILGAKSRGVFNGKIFVRIQAQKTDAKQTNKTLLLSDEARIDTKPQLEIFADDVKCTHGATVGQLDAEQLFYLRSRGIDEVSSRDILTFAFAADVVGKIRIKPLRVGLEALIRDELLAGSRQGGVQ